MLEARNLTVAYGRHRAIEDVSIDVGKGEICVILGANGAGKSTLLNAIAGMVATAPGGAVSIDGRTLRGLKPGRIVEAGIALVPEGRGIFGDLTVRENLQLGAYARRARRRERASLDRVYALFPRLAERRDQSVRTMSGGEQQMVAIGRALMSSPDILMLDEPSLGLSPILTTDLFNSLARIRDDGVGILLVEQNARQSLRIAGRGYLLENGHVSESAPADVLERDPAVIKAYLGGSEEEDEMATPLVTIPPDAPIETSRPGEIAAMAAHLASRAGAIRATFQHARRRAAPVPSAFVGRYDPAADPGPAIRIDPLPLHPGADARSLAAMADDLARRAADRLAAHLISRRLSARIPSAFLKSPDRAPAAAATKPDRGDPPPQAGREPELRTSSDLTKWAEQLAKRAANQDIARRAHDDEPAAGRDDRAAEGAETIASIGAHIRGKRDTRTQTEPAAAAGSDLEAIARQWAERAKQGTGH